MGRYTSVQAYADNNANVRTISYDQATGGDGNANKSVVTEKVSNPYGSTAGAGSGEFHVYRHARAREAARWKELDASQKESQLDEDFRDKLHQAQNEEDKKTAKRRKKRQREKEAKLRKKNLKAGGILLSNNSSQGINPDTENEEFTYVPLEQLESEKKKTESSKESKETKPEEIPNDGTFLERMMKLQQPGQRGVATEQAGTKLPGDEGDDEGPMLPPPAKRPALESRIIDEDEEEGPLLPSGFY